MMKRNPFHLFRTREINGTDGKEIQLAFLRREGIAAEKERDEQQASDDAAGIPKKYNPEVHKRPTKPPPQSRLRPH